MYKVTEKGYESLTVTKVKDILSCQDRQSARTSMLSTPFTSPNVSIRDLSSKIYKLFYLLVKQNTVLKNLFQRHHARKLIKTFREESELISLLNIGYYFSQ